jgi:molybdate transport system substrate-binding protein
MGAGKGRGKTMIRRTLILCTVAAVAGFGLPGTAYAAEIKVLTSVALTSALDELAPMFEKATGDKLTIGYELAAELKKSSTARPPT